ncbi:hypothetical protein [Actinomadura decatromicini]|uniref:Uncharacterized protein n=1 Tax=Actinomadura decatromicini TaxID=2604572 RepID=A0A5D3FR91_9ACTN|nr:hypothetical protein [Actinomadura decatromicini]TYK50574.1 hypothetical protein FXF68_08640 [Actinomadura decatromicini]
MANPSPLSAADLDRIAEIVGRLDTGKEIIPMAECRELFAEFYPRGLLVLAAAAEAADHMRELRRDLATT